MIGFDSIGTMGRLGNQMFQHAAVKGIARKHGYEYAIPPKDPSSQIDNYGLLDAFEMKGVDHIKYCYNVVPAQERFFHYDEELMNICPDNVNVAGFFQSEKHFEHIEDEIRKDYTFKNNWLQPSLDFMDQFGGEEVLFLHVRRGDPNLTDVRGFKWAYTECASQHPPQPVDYYERALKEFPENQPVVVCSDSPEWVKEQEFFADDRFLISEPTDKYPDGSYEPFVDLCIMSLCSGAITANSSMSWWGAWLQNGRGPVVAPKQWFGPDYKDKDLKDLYCDGWIVT